MPHALLPLVYQTRNQWLFAHVASDETYFTGVAVLNSGGESVNVTLTVLDAAGRPASSRASTLAPRSRLVKLLPEILPALPSMRSGSIRVNASQPVAACAIFGTHSLSALAAIPGH